jgi:hypothetical protein
LCGSGGEGELYSLQPTWKLIPGTCFKSLAFAVARDCGLPPSVLAAAESDYHAILQGGSSMSAAYEKIVEIARGSRAGMDSGSGSSSSSSYGTAVGSVDHDATSGSWVGARQQQQMLVRQTAEVAEGQDWECDRSDGGESEGAEGEADEKRYDFPAIVSTRSSRVAGLLQQADSSSSKGLDKVKLDDARASVQLLFEQMQPSLLSAAPAEVAPAAETAVAEQTDAAGRRRRRRKQTGQDPLQDVQVQASQQPAAAEGALGNGGPQYAVVHELLPGMQPPPAHEGESVLYMLLDESSWWYGGETQVRAPGQQDQQQWCQGAGEGACAQLRHPRETSCA